MAWTTNDKVMELRERWHPFDVFAEMMDGWRRHLSGRNASLLAFFSFLSIFPLMLAAVTILGFVLDGNEELQRTIVDSAASQIPVLGQQLAEDPQAIQGNVFALLIGLGAALWSSTKAFVGLQGALDDTWEVHVDDRDGLPKVRGKALIGLAIIALSQVASIVVASVVSEAGLPALSNLALLAATVALNIAVIAAMYRVLTSYDAKWSDVWFGAIFAGCIFTLLQTVGTNFVKTSAEAGNAAMGTINTVLALITWLSLIGITVIMCAELNSARKRLREGIHPDGGAHLNIPIRTATPGKVLPGS